MTRFNGHAAVYCLSVAILSLQVGSGGAGPTSETTTTTTTNPSAASMTDTIVGDLSNGAEAVANRVKSGVNDTSTTLNNIMELTTGGLTGLVKSTGTTAWDLGAEAFRSAEEGLKAGSRVTLAIGNLCNQLFSGLSAGVATGTEILAMGTHNVDSFLSGVPIIGVVTGGLHGLVSGVSSTVNQMSNSGRESRAQLMKKLRSELNQSYQTSQDATTAATNKSDTATATAESVTV